MMAFVNPLYVKLAIGCFVTAIVFFFITIDNLVKGKFGLPSWVISLFTMTIVVFFMRIFLISLNEFQMGRHRTLDQMMDVWEIIIRFLT